MLVSGVRRIVCLDSNGKLAGVDEVVAGGDGLGLYMGAPEHALVLPMLPATPQRRTRDYVRHGTTSLFAASDLASGPVIVQPQKPGLAPKRSRVRRDVPAT